MRPKNRDNPPCPDCGAYMRKNSAYRGKAFDSQKYVCAQCGKSMTERFSHGSLAAKERVQYQSQHKRKKRPAEHPPAERKQLHAACQQAYTLFYGEIRVPYSKNELEALRDIHRERGTKLSGNPSALPKELMEAMNEVV